ncbi:hypothetical protein niasHS_003802 [Heterodera schachtii]|uniref:RFX-type winged-helix domain-containing protein n=1 Tax=Heterodera schachtii TaxID=97005 RepID=A0ABD2K6Q5_HETSC
MRRGPPAMPTVSTSACGYAGGAWAIFGQMPAHSNVATPSLSAHPAHALLAAHGTAGFSGAAALFATVSTAPYCQPTSLLQRQQQNAYAAAAVTNGEFEQHNNAGGHQRNSAEYGGQQNVYYQQQQQQQQHYHPIQQQQNSDGNTPPALGQHATYVLRQQHHHHPATAASAAGPQHFQRHKTHAELGTAQAEKQSLVVVVEASGNIGNDKHGKSNNSKSSRNREEEEEEEDGTAGDGTEDEAALLTGDDGSQEAGGTGHTMRAAPETLEWLHANYESYPGASLPRCTLYEHYQNHCREIGISPVNAASFGKLIRNSFKDLLTRRLGTRGNSKYHYSGIRIKPSSALLRDGFPRVFPSGSDDAAQEQPQQQRHHATPTARGTRRNGTRKGSNQTQHKSAVIAPAETNSCSSIDVAMMDMDGADEAATQRQQRGQSADFPLPDAFSASAGAALPRVSLPLDDSLDEALLPLGLTVQHALKFQMDYEAHNSEVLECLRHLRLESVENVWARFWAGASDSDNGRGTAGAEEELLPGGHQMQLCRDVLFRLCSVPQLLAFVQNVDLCFYQLLLDQLLSDPLRPSPSAAHPPNRLHLLLPQMRPFAKNLCASMAKALGAAAPSALRELKLAGVRLLSNAITRLSSVAHLAVTAREVLQSDEQMEQMHADFARLDFAVLHEQVEWCCDWSSGWLRSLEEQFGAGLSQRRRLEEWADWLDSLAARVLQTPAPLTPARSPQDTPPTAPEAQFARGKQLLLAWTFWSSLVLRDFTLRSAASFGQFHLIRLLFDDYLSISVERRLAQLSGQPAIALMAPEWLQLRPSPLSLPPQPQQHPALLSSAPLFFRSHPPPPSSVSVYAPPNFPSPPPTTTISSSTAAVAVQQQPFFAGRNRVHSFHQNSPLNPLSDPLPPPGPEPPMDMLNGTDEGVNASEDCRGGGNADGAIRFFGAGERDGGERRRIKQEQDEAVDEQTAVVR